MKVRDQLTELREAVGALQYGNQMKQVTDLLDASRLHAEMRRAFDAVKAFQFIDPWRETRDALNALQICERLQRSHEVTKALQSLSPATGTRLSAISTQVSDLSKIAAEMQKVFQDHDPAKDLRKMKKSIEHYSAIRDVYDNLTPSVLESILKTISKEEWPLAYSHLDGDIAINNNNTITLNSETLNRAEVQRIANEITDRALNSSSEQLEQAIKQLVAEIRALKNPALERILSLLIYPIILALIFSFINPIADFYIKESLSSKESFKSRKKEIEKKIKRHVLASTERVAEIESYRLVSGKLLNVRLNPSARSPAIGQLHWGQVVVLVERRDDWSLVAWSDEENSVAIQGWVFSRYLSKFR